MSNASKALYQQTNEMQYRAILQQLALKRRKAQQISFYEHLKNELFKSLSLYHFESGLLESYFKEVSTYHTKINLKNCMKMIIIFFHFSVALNYYFSPGTVMSTFLSLICLVLVMVCYMFTLLLTTYHKIIFTSMFVLLSCYVSNILTQASLFGMIETNFTPALQINLLMFAILPVRLTVALNIALINFAFVGAISMLMISRKKTFDTVNGYMSTLTLLEGIHEVPLFSKDINVYRYFGALGVFMISMLFIAIYLHYMNNIRRRSAFWTLGENVKAKRSIKMTMRQQLKFIEAVMPSVVKEEYWTHSEEIKSDKWIYIKTFDNVSILFADIVGFTKMSSNKTALQVVLLLNDLFNRFDELCNATNCEKLGTLGDCYYCVAGCPIPRPDHAVCCIEMGLGMCRIIDQFNKDHKEEVNMRVGVHTGRVNAAIIGKKRFKFDVYSNDVIIANSMESNGEPGRVHISESCYAFVKGNYKVENGNGLEIKKEETQGIAGSLLKTFKIKTYFVDPKSSHFNLDLKKNAVKPAAFKVFSSKNQKRKTIKHKTSNSDSDNDSEKAQKQQEKIHESLNFIQGLRYDPDRQITLFSLLPINSFTLMFHDKELEWHFRTFTLEEMADITVESMKSAKFLDCTICTIYCLFINLEAVILFHHLDFTSILILLIHLFCFVILTLVSGWHCYVTYSQLNNSIKKLIYSILSTSFFKVFYCFFFQNSTTVTIIFLFYDCVKLYTDYSYTINFFLLTFSTTFIVPLYFAADYLVKLFCSTLLFSFVIFVFIFSPCVDKTENYPNLYIFAPHTCLGAQNNTHVMFINRIKMGFVSQIFIVYLLSILLIREVERNVRLWFFISREAEIGREETQIAMKNAEQVLYNIIPQYVFENLMEQYEGNMENFSFSYAVTIPRCAVIFASLSNFFSKYYREDYKGGENALRLLHQIIKMFDDIMEKRRYKDVEKIKTINDCYMVASGLNTTETSKNSIKSAHLIALLHYGFDLIKSLDNFNDNYIVGTDKFEIKIGYNFGTVTAGIIGLTKPMYDIWGDTVNVASRMYSTGEPGQIQVPDYVEKHLKNYFLFKYRGKIFVKGKGDMNTYIAEKQVPSDKLRRRENQDSDPKIKKRINKESMVFKGFTVLEFSD